jgi:hypothetical protein
MSEEAYVRGIVLQRLGLSHTSRTLSPLSKLISDGTKPLSPLLRKTMLVNNSSLFLDVTPYQKYSSTAPFSQPALFSQSIGPIVEQKKLARAYRLASRFTLPLS